MQPYALGFLFAAGALSLTLLTSACTPIPSHPPQEGSHGFRTWQSTRFISTLHEGERLCVPRGWSPVGAMSYTGSWATFPSGTTAVFMRDDAFASTTLTFSQSSYTVSLYYPEDTGGADRARYERMVRSAFEKLGALFADTHPAREHSVIVTAGLGLIEGEHGSVYPDPGPQVSYLILHPNNPRSEELFIHAIAHLYNRFGGTSSAQPPLSAGDFEELEASWAEIAFLSSQKRRTARVEELYEVHQAALQGEAFRSPPFSDAEEMKTLRRGLPVPEDASYAEHQYNHYILAPLAAVAIDGLLAVRGTGTTLAELLARRSAGEYENVFDELRALLSSEDMGQIMQWLAGAEIPRPLLEVGLAQY